MKWFSADAIKKCTVATLTKSDVVSTTEVQGSIRTEFKRMANELKGIEGGVNKRTEALKKAWDIPDSN